MASAYFTLPSFSRTSKQKQEGDKASTKDPVLNDADEQFLTNITSTGPRTHIPTTQITDNGSTVETSEQSSEGVVVLPGKQSAEKSSSVEQGDSSQSPGKKTKNALNELPSQEEAEAATKGFQAGALAQAPKSDEKKTWASYIPPLPSVSLPKISNKSDDSRTWSEYAQSCLQDLPALPASWTRSNAKAEVVYKDDGSVDEEATKAKQEKDLSALLDKLSLASTNNIVFSISQESQKFYERFVQVLKDVVNGVPTAYEDMETLMKDAGPTIEKQWNSMPPFVQTLVKALPAKLSASFAPELLAAASEKPSLQSKQVDGKDNKKKTKRYFKIPGLKGLVKKQGLAATMLRNIVVFFETRFPLLMSATNVAMSLSVFVLMFVFYYCWKRGREVRLAGESSTNEDDDEDVEIEVTDEDDEETSQPQAEPKSDAVAESVGNPSSSTMGEPLHAETAKGPN